MSATTTTRRSVALLCVMLTLFTLVSPLMTPRVAAVDSPFQDSMEKLMSWNVMRGYSDGNLRPENPISRAEFLAMVNRAYGYTETGTKKFSDVSDDDWFADDVSIAYNAGYFSGSSNSTAEPRSELSREQAMVLLARSMRLDSVPGEVTEFSDGRDFGNYSKGYVKAAIQRKLIDGYPDGTFRPKNSITRGAMAKILANAIGTLVNTSGVQSLGDVYGNVTVNTSNVTLKDTTIAGDLYLSGGLGLGDVTLDNVTVLGRIVVAGGGESEQGDNSIVLRNTTADSLLVDSLSGQYVSLSADGDTSIPNTIVRSSAYLEDRTPADYGLKNISLEGTDQNRYSLAGTLKNVVNRSPQSTLGMAQGTLENLTIDEKATGSSLTIGSGAIVKTLNLDTGTPVNGSGDIDHLNVNAAGSSTTMLPDTITIRPGITATIAGQTMDSSTALEASSDPRLLAGYPKAADVAPTTATAVFSTNKSGTVYWAISSVSDGSIGEDDLISPAAYGGKAVQSGNISVTSSNTEFTAKLTGLTSGGSYYLSAVLVDARGSRSPVKVYSFSTPDNTVPNFATGYPYMSKLTDTSGQANVMTTKDCTLYYALLPKGSTAPTTDNFKSASITGNLGYGVIDAKKNVPELFTVNNQPLEELESYDLYLWLTDADGGKNSAIKKLTFTTIDKTPPVFRTSLVVNDVKATSLGATCTLNENGTVFWVAVKAGEEYPKPPVNGTAFDKWESDYAKLQVANGMNGLKSGKITVRGDVAASLTISGLTAETTYDIYYLAQDTAGNYSKRIEMITANTLDTMPPTVKQEFTKYSGNTTSIPFPDTDIRVIFSEGVQQASTDTSLMTLYTAVADAKTPEDRETARNAMANVLASTIAFYNIPATGQPELVKIRSADDQTDWGIDYRNAKISMEDGKVVVTFPTTTDANYDSALKLSSGSTYYFQISDIADTSTAKNIMGVTKMDEFTTISAQVYLAAANVTTIDTVDGQTDIPVDMTFTMTPISTAKADAEVDWDMLIWSDTTVSFQVYQRVLNSDKTEHSGWESVTNINSTTNTPSNITITVPDANEMVGRSLGRDFQGLTSFPKLMTMDEDLIYEYAIHFTTIKGFDGRDTWSQAIQFKINIVTGSSTDLSNLAANVTKQNYDTALSRKTVTDITSPEDFTMFKQFSDTVAPEFEENYPNITPHDTSVTLQVMLSRPGTVYYLVSPFNLIPSTNKKNADGSIEPVQSGEPPVGAKGVDEDHPMLNLTSPGYLSIINPADYYPNQPSYKTGTASVGTGAIDIDVTGLDPKTEYFVYFVLKGTEQTYSDVILYSFTTTELTRPVLTLNLDNPSVLITSNISADVNYALITYTQQYLNQIILGKEFFLHGTTYLASGVTEDQIKEAYGKDEGYEKMTILEAMNFSVTKDNQSIGSLFDLFANQATKDDVANYIRGASPNSNNTIAGVGTTAVAAGSTNGTTVNCRNMSMSAGTRYAFLAVGKNNTNIGSGDAFSAVYPLTLPDDIPPMIKTVIASGPVDENTGKFVGTISIIFDGELYYMERGNPLTAEPDKFMNVDNAPLTASRKDDYTSVESLVAKDAGSGLHPLTNGSVNVNNNGTISFSVNQGTDSNVVAGGTRIDIVLRTVISDASSNTHNVNCTVSIAFVRDPDTKKYTGEYTVTINPSDWDDREA